MTSSSAAECELCCDVTSALGKLLAAVLLGVDLPIFFTCRRDILWRVDTKLDRSFDLVCLLAEEGCAFSDHGHVSCDDRDVSLPHMRGRKPGEPAGSASPESLQNAAPVARRPASPSTGLLRDMLEIT